MHNYKHCTILLFRTQGNAKELKKLTLGIPQSPQLPIDREVEVEMSSGGKDVLTYSSGVMAAARMVLTAPAPQHSTE